MSIAKNIVSNPHQTGLVDPMEQQAIREHTGYRAVGEFGSGDCEYTFADGSKLHFYGGDEDRKVEVMQ